MVCNAILEHRTRGEAGRWRSEWRLLVISASRESREQVNVLGRAELDPTVNQCYLNGKKSVGMKMYSTLQHRKLHCGRISH